MFEPADVNNSEDERPKFSDSLDENKENQVINEPNSTDGIFKTPKKFTEGDGKTKKSRARFRKDSLEKGGKRKSKKGKKSKKARKSKKSKKSRKSRKR